MRTLSVGSVAGAKSPAFLLLLLDSISCGAKRGLLGFVVTSGGVRGIDVAPDACSGVGGAAFASCLLLDLVVSTGVGRNLFFGTAKSCRSVFSFVSAISFCFRLDLVSSTGTGANRLVTLGGGGEVSVMVEE
jgi:hypothetical protein